MPGINAVLRKRAELLGIRRKWALRAEVDKGKQAPPIERVQLRLVLRRQGIPHRRPVRSGTLPAEDRARPRELSRRESVDVLDKGKVPLDLRRLRNEVVGSQRSVGRGVDVEVYANGTPPSRSVFAAA